MVVNTNIKAWIRNACLHKHVSLGRVSARLGFPLCRLEVVGKAVKEDGSPQAFVLCFLCVGVAKKGRLLETDELRTLNAHHFYYFFRS